MELAGGAILDGAPSAELAALLEGIADISVDGVPKFTPMTRQALVRLIVGRAYAPPLLELCHLLRVAALAPRGRFELFFWGVKLARAASYAGWLRTQLAKSARGIAGGPAVATEPGGVAIAYVDGRFSISYGRMPLLAGLMEFLVSALGYPAVLDQVEELLAGPASCEAASATANRLSRAVYAWLTPHLPTAHDKRRLDSLVGWLLARHGGDFGPGQIDDGAILAFWLTAEEAEFRTYASVVRGFLLLIEAMEASAAALSVARAASLGTDAESGELDPAAPDSPGSDGGGQRLRVMSAEEVDAGADPLATLAEPPADAIKLLNGRERADAELLLEAGPGAERLMLSLLRRAVFGAVQARLSEALRRGGLAGAARVLAAAFEQPAADSKPAQPASYADWIARADELASHIERVMLASLHVLARAGRAETAHLLVALAGAADLAWLRNAGGTADPARLGERLQNPVIAGPAAAALMLRARRSFQSLSRAGFEPDAVGRADVVEGHAAAAAELPRLAARLARVRAAMARRPVPVWADQEAADRQLFAARFAAIYAITGGETP